MKAVFDRLDALAADVAHVQRRCEPGSPLGHLAKRVAAHVAWLDVLLRPPAGELTRSFFAECGDWALATQEALRVVDDRDVRLRRLLGEEEQ